MNSHYAVLVFGGDFDNDHPDEELRGHAPQLTLLGAGDEAWCWDVGARWTKDHPLRRDETFEVLARDPAVVADGAVAAETYTQDLIAARVADGGGRLEKLPLAADDEGLWTIHPHCRHCAWGHEHHPDLAPGHSTACSSGCS